jgi:hypothetical protein
MNSPRNRCNREERQRVRRKGTLIIVPCGSQKIWDRNPRFGMIPAKDAYTSVLFKVHREYAETFGTAWLILSARYGFTHPDQLIENYDFKFDHSDLEPKNWWRLRAMIRQAHTFAPYQKVVLLGGKLYREITRRVLLGIVLPHRIAEPFANCDLPATIRSVQKAIAKKMGLTERVYRLQRQLRELPLTPLGNWRPKKRAQLAGQLIQAARDDGCLSKIDPTVCKSSQIIDSK